MKNCNDCNCDCNEILTGGRTPDFIQIANVVDGDFSLPSGVSAVEQVFVNLGAGNSANIDLPEFPRIGDQIEFFVISGTATVRVPSCDCSCTPTDVVVLTTGQTAFLTFTPSQDWFVTMGA